MISTLENDAIAAPPGQRAFKAHVSGGSHGAQDVDIQAECMTCALMALADAFATGKVKGTKLSVMEFECKPHSTPSKKSKQS